MTKKCAMWLIGDDNMCSVNVFKLAAEKMLYTQNKMSQKGVSIVHLQSPNCVYRKKNNFDYDIQLVSK